MRRGQFLIKVLVCIFLVICGYSAYLHAQTEEITLTTFYPSPYGVYQIVRFFPSLYPGPGSGPVVPCGGVTCGACQNNGEVFYDAGHQLFVCVNGAWRMIAGESGSLFWELGGLGIHNINNAGVTVESGLQVNGPAGINSGPGAEMLFVNGTAQISQNTGIGAAPNGQMLYVAGNTQVDGHVGVGTAPHGTFSIYTPGTIRAEGSSDLAEAFLGDVDIEAGDVVVIDSQGNKRIAKTTIAYDRRVAGIISTEPGLQLGPGNGPHYKPLALEGQVPCKVTAQNGAIEPGDLLVASSKPGYAMKLTLLDYTNAVDFEQLKSMIAENEKRRSAVVGRALEPLPEGEGKITVLLEK
ncbi:MAG: hypothetical protein JXD21_01995 [Candidatus Omnitrophica bacterium]|nr:hypothetical protein [Candidatus Omnitrophota bacterium]